MNTKGKAPRGRNWDNLQEEFIYELAETRMANGEMMSLSAITMFYNEEFNGKYDNWIERPPSAIASRLNKVRARKKDEMLREKRRQALVNQRENYQREIKETVEEITPENKHITLDAHKRLLKSERHIKGAETKRELAKTHLNLGKTWSMDDKIYLYENWDVDGIFGATTISNHAQEVADTLSRTLDSCRTKHYVLSRDKKFLKRYEEMYGIRKDGAFEKYMEEKNEVKTLEDIVEYRGFTALFFRLYTWSKNRKDRKRMKKELKRQAQEKYRRYVEDLE